VITGNDIIEYMKVVLKSVEQFEPKLPERTTHLTHGNVKLMGGVKMSSRKGNFVRAVDVLEMAEGLAREIAAAPGEQPLADAAGRRSSEAAAISRAVALGAVKYAFLKNRLGPDLIFDPKESVNLYGNSGPYLQYSLARAKSILRKVAGESDEVSERQSPRQDFDNKGVAETKSLAGRRPSLSLSETSSTLTPTERDLALKLMEHEGVLGQAVVELEPAGVCNYLYELAQAFSRFYENNRVVGGENAEFRQGLVKRYTEVLERDFGILGIPVLEKI
jgi:arginyl-tRNA synthetase